MPKGFNTSSIVPYFILTEMPPFVGGLLIAAIFAAAQSTKLNKPATTMTNRAKLTSDLSAPFPKKRCLISSEIQAGIA
jgi:Na+/pantothenate symporter